MNRSFLVFPIATGLALLSPSASRAQDAEAGQVLFKKDCGICHSPTAGKNGVGPSLSGIAGRAAGAVAGFRYTDANKNSGLTWDAATLDRYLAAPRTVIPGTTMTYSGQKDDGKRRDLIAYLATLH
jgi:cytochrome c